METTPQPTGMIPYEAAPDDSVAQRLQVVYEGIDGDTVMAIEDHRIAATADYVARLAAIRDLLAPFGKFKEWCQAADVNYKAITTAIGRQFGQVAPDTRESHSSLPINAALTGGLPEPESTPATQPATETPSEPLSLPAREPQYVWAVDPDMPDHRDEAYTWDAAKGRYVLIPEKERNRRQPVPFRPRDAADAPATEPEEPKSDDNAVRWLDALRRFYDAVRVLDCQRLLEAYILDLQITYRDDAAQLASTVEDWKELIRGLPGKGPGERIFGINQLIERLQAAQQGEREYQEATPAFRKAVDAVEKARVASETEPTVRYGDSEACYWFSKGEYAQTRSLNPLLLADQHSSASDGYGLGDWQGDAIAQASHADVARWIIGLKRARERLQHASTVVEDAIMHPLRDRQIVDTTVFEAPSGLLSGASERAPTQIVDTTPAPSPEPKEDDLAAEYVGKVRALNTALDDLIAVGRGKGTDPIKALVRGPVEQAKEVCRALKRVQRLAGYHGFFTVINGWDVQVDLLDQNEEDRHDSLEEVAAEAVEDLARLGHHVILNVGDGVAPGPDDVRPVIGAALGGVTETTVNDGQVSEASARRFMQESITEGLRLVHAVEDVLEEARYLTK